MTLLRSQLAPSPRTLVDIFQDTVDAYPDLPALDNGAEILTYTEFAEAVSALALALRSHGIGAGDRVGVRIRSGTLDLYVAIMSILAAGAAYVPVDADDPEERADLVFSEAGACAVVGDDLTITKRRDDGPPGTVSSDDAMPGPLPGDDAWVIFTSGSTGVPKGVAVSHRSAAALVDAEARMYLQDSPVGPGDRVMAGLSVAFDASCEEMWLAWRHGACLVPVPRSLVRSGVDLGPWLVANDISVVSTVPTLVALWPRESLRRVRLLILGGEACPPELGASLVRVGREVWNTYGPTEATVVACGAPLSATGPVRIGLPLDGWDLAVVDRHGRQVAPGEVGELIIGGVGLGRYLDPARDAEKYAAMPNLGWQRAYRSGDLVRYEEAGLLFVGRADEQVKLGGRRIELGEIDSQVGGLPGVRGAAAAVRRTSAGNAILVAYVVVDAGFNHAAAMERLRSTLPAPLVPRLARVETLPTKTSGKIDRDALPWPVADVDAVAQERPAFEGTQAWVADLWHDILGAVVTGEGDDFFDLGGGSLTAAQLVSRLRNRFPEVTVADVYERPTLGALCLMLDEMATPSSRSDRRVRPTPPKTQVGQVALTLPLRTVAGLRWLTWLAAGADTAAEVFSLPWLPTVPWWLVAVGLVLLVTPPGRMGLAAAGARLLLRGITPGDYPRGGKVHLRLWFAERLADELCATNLSGATWMPLYARALGAKVGRNVDLHSLPPVTGFLSLGNGCSIEPEVDLTGHWVDGDVLHLGSIRVGAGARVGARSMLCPGASVGRAAEIAPGSAVFGKVPKGEFWSGAPVRYAGPARGPWAERPPYRPRWIVAYAAAATLIASLPLIATVAAVAVASPWLSATSSLGDAARMLPWLVPLGALTWLLTLTLLIWLVVRLLGLGLQPGPHPVHSRVAWQCWATLRVMDEARGWLFPIYASLITPAWFRALGARVGSGAEISTALLIPRLTTINDGAFLADDTMIGGYELGGGWLRVERAKIGKRAFVGNSGMTAPGRKVPKQSLVAVLSAAPRRAEAKAGMSWLGSPPERLRRQASEVDSSRTYDPPTRLKVARACVETCRLIAVVVAAGISTGVVLALAELATRQSWWLAALAGGVVLMAAGAVSACVSVAAKWVLVGRLRAESHPLWSFFVWRNELADTFIEVLTAPWFARVATGTPILNVWLRALGARIGRGVWCETYWLPEADLVRLGDGATVNQGCVVQTHLFHDRVLSMDQVTLRAGATLGPNSVILPAAALGRHASVGPVSLVMRGESVPPRTRWIGNPIGPWLDDLDRPDAASHLTDADDPDDPEDPEERVGEASAGSRS